MADASPLYCKGFRFLREADPHCIPIARSMSSPRIIKSTNQYTFEHFPRKAPVNDSQEELSVGC